MEDEVNRAWDKWRIRKSRRKKRDCLTDLAGCWWCIWKARNDMIFKTIQPNPERVVITLRQLLKEALVAPMVSKFANNSRIFGKTNFTAVYVFFPKIRKKSRFFGEIFLFAFNSRFAN
ncbi:uncharacterized protein LOC109725101 [Ananas comosus]|uniref:Uncharacterized protein LOC109725101 n=1 Tax=Ananas comosus TaxID=4615 RepID=A0A6P5GV99_ANACO|nr:uncharacterized protein LOC109725101 [Ananas comosus]